jgi:hypothetical protein
MYLPNPCLAISLHVERCKDLFPAWDVVLPALAAASNCQFGFKPIYHGGLFVSARR